MLFKHEHASTDSPRAVWLAGWLAPGGSLGSYDLCHGCRMPITEKDKLSSHYVKGVSCSNCVNEKTSSQIQRYKTRQKQINLAKAKNKNHLGPKAS